MKKRNLVLSLVAFMAGGLALTACDPVKKNEGTILTVNNGSEVAKGITVDDIFNKYITKSSGISAYYNAICEVIVRASIKETEAITNQAKLEVNRDKDKAKSNSKTNGTSYDDELDKIFESKGVKNLEELEDYYVYDKLKEKSREEYFDKKEGNGKFELLGDYINKMVPYHVSHILINVSASATDQGYKGQITEDETTKLVGAIKRLAKGNETFGSVAQSLSGDTGSAEKFGEGGLVTLDTSYVNEFKLGLYTFDAIYNSQAKAESTKRVNMTETASTYFEAKKENTAAALKIPFEQILEMESVASKTKDDLGNVVNDGDANYYPRNIYFNNLFNSHQVSLITTKNPGTNKGFKNATDVPALSNMLEPGEYALCSGNKPILVVRSGSGNNSDGGYQGVFFIVAEKSGLTENTADLKKYYDYKKSIEDYSNNIGSTYVNFNVQENSEYRARANIIKNAVESFDKLIDTSIFEFYWNSNPGKFKINDEIKVTVPTYENGERKEVTLTLEEAIFQYIRNTREYNEYNDERNMNKTWNEFVENLQQIDQMRENRLVSMDCATNFGNASSSELFEKGGACSVVKVSK